MQAVLVGPEIEENLSLRYLAAALEHAGHSCRIVPFAHRADIPRAVNAIHRENPQLVGLSLVFQSRAAEFNALVEALRRRGYRGHITAGGHFASLRAAEVLNDVPGIDTVLHHEGERRIVELANWLGTSPEPPASLDGITWRGAGGGLSHRPPRAAASLDGLAPPVRRRPDRVLGLASAPLVASRGCAGSCTFCSIRAWHRQVANARLRLRAPEQVATEMAALHREHGVRIFVFHDDDFILPNPRQAFERCRSILERAESEIGVPFGFVVKCRPDDVREDLFAYLREKGLVRAYVGIETHAACGLRTLGRGATPADNERALDILARLGIYGCFNLLLFDPDTTLAALDENLAFLKRHVEHPFEVARTELYAGTALETRMICMGRAFGDYRGWDYRIADARVEAIFRLFVESLWDRHFSGGSILHRTQDLGYKLALLGRFHPAVAGADLARRVASLVHDVDLDTLANFGELRRFVVQREPETESQARHAFARELRQEAARRDGERFRRCLALSLELEARAQLARLGIAERLAVDVWPRGLGRLAASLPYAAMALGALSCQEHSIDPPPPPAVRFSRDIEPRFDRTCAVSDCHDATTAAAGLVLAQGQSYSSLVNVPSSELPSMRRVEPGQPDSSYVVHKLLGTQAAVGGNGEPMPPGGPADATLSDAVQKWIAEGAKDD